MSVKLDDLRLKVFNDRYALKDENGNQLEFTPEEMWQRVAKTLARVESTIEKQKEYEKEFYDTLCDFQFLPGGRILAGAGAKSDLTFYNCFVLPSPDDSREGIIKSVGQMMEMMARGGGVGVNLSTLRPKGSYVRGVNGKSSGAVSFGGLYAFATGLITQGGSRRGALMLMLNCDHPDIEEFVTIKNNFGEITNANLSICISDDFMEAVKNDADWNLKWGGEVKKTIKARYLWNLICESAWASGEPGVYFLERANKQSNTWYFEKLISTNPCGEQPLSAWSVCNLGAINLSAFVSEKGVFEEERLRKRVRTAVRLLDNVIDISFYPFDQNKKVQKEIRRIGLGTMGLADALIKLHLRYGSEEAKEWCRKTYKLIRDEAYWASVGLAEEKGSFPKFDRDKYLQGYFIKKLPRELQDAIWRYGIRNAVLLTQAPTGTTSLFAGTSSGIEPVYDFVFIRRDRLGEHEIFHPIYKKWIDEHPEEPLPDYFVTAKNLTPDEHVEVQAIIQEFTDSSISKTVNAPEHHTVEDVKRLYMKAYELGCKGITYFRENSRDSAVLYSRKDKEKPLSYEKSIEATAGKEAQPKSEERSKEVSFVVPPSFHPEPRPRPDVTTGMTYKVKTGYGTMYITINQDEAGKPFEIFATIGKTGGFFAAKSESICRMVSLALRSGIEPQLIINQLKGIRGPMPAWTERGQILSIPDAIAKILEEHITSAQTRLRLDYVKQIEKEKEKELDKPQAVPFSEVVTEKEKLVRGEGPGAMAAPIAKKSIADRGVAPECPECGGMLEFSEGCMLCRGCGFSKCS